MNSIQQSSADQPTLEFPAFYKLSSGYFGAETTRDQGGEFLSFTVLGIITAWPIVSMIMAVSRMLRN